MTDNNSTGDGFSREYVEKLRSEAAGYRTQLRELEATQAQGAVATELANRGIKADPAWVTMGEGMTASDAVEDLLARYPHLATAQSSQPAPKAPQPAVAAAPLPTRFPSVQAPASANTNLPSNPSEGRSLSEIQKDPVARSQLRDRYRQLLQQGSRQRS